MTTTRPCSVGSCTRTHYARTYCKPHYYRWQKDGHPGEAVIRRYVPVPEACAVEDCERKPKARGYCGGHYARWRASENPGTATFRPWVTSGEPGYIAAHIRVKNLRGRAATHRCEHCDEQAMDWAYNHEDPNELTEVGGRDAEMTYSLDPACYFPLCRPCHARFDAPHSKRQAV